MTPLQVLIGRKWMSTSAGARRKFRLACPWFHQPAHLANVATDDALALTTIVRDEEPRVVFGALSYYSHKELSLIAVALAAMIPTDRTPTELLAWLDTLGSPREVIRGA